jgi:hypothetical protein
VSTSTTYAELEIGLHRSETGTYQVELRFTNPESEAEIPPARGTVSFDPGQLLALQHEPGAYGEALADQLFQDEGVRDLYRRARTVVEARDAFLRLRLMVTASAPELHAVRWELLCDPDSRAPLACSEKTPFSRFMRSHDWRPATLRARADLRALVAVAAPTNLARYQLAEIDGKREIERACAVLEGIQVTVLGREQPLTEKSLLAHLRDGIDVLYLVCHGALIRNIPRLYLQDEDGEVEVADGDQLARRIGELGQVPRLVILASCESAGAEHESGTGEPAAEAALAPRLAEAGVLAIIAMQGKISMATVEQAMPVFFSELLRDGQIDRAMAVARGTVRERPDAWMPALYLRLKRGCIWYVPGFAGEDDFSKWRAITSSVRQSQFVPIISTDVSAHIMGSTGELADRLGLSHGYPMSVSERTDLAKVSQFLTVDQSRKYARDEVLKQAHRQIVERYPDLAGAEQLSLPKLLDAVLERCQDDDPFRILAQLPAPLYITASPIPQLTKALKAAGREPVPLLCDWRPSRDNHPRKPAYEGEPSPEKPAVYHVYGILGKPNSLVLTEDDFFDFLIATAEYKLLPTVVGGYLIRSSLIFLGFHINDLSFRALFRLIVNLGGSHQMRDHAHVGVQIDPEEHTLSDVEGARRYLEGYFESGVDAPPISIYWGSAADFLNDLRDQLARSSDEVIPATAEEDEDDWF